MADFTVYCPLCEAEWPEYIEYQEYDPSVGAHEGVLLGDGIECPECHHIFTDSDRAKEEERILERIRDDGSD